MKKTMSPLMKSREYINECLECSFENLKEEGYVLPGETLEECLWREFLAESNPWIHNVQERMETWLQGLPAWHFDFEDYRIIQLKNEWGYKTPDWKFLDTWWKTIASKILLKLRKAGVDIYNL